MLSDCVATPPRPSVALIVKVYDPAVVGVPDNDTGRAVFIDRPGGNEPLETENVTAPEPPAVERV